MRERVCEPVPHVLVHASKPLQAETTQSTAHASVLHDCVSERNGHTLPPWSALVVTERERLCEPPPQLRVQVDHPEKADVMQWIGHGPRLHDSVSLSAPHTTPPLAVAVATARPRECVPAPHECEQLPHESQDVVTQSTGHACALHVRVAESDAHATPP